MLAVVLVGVLLLGLPCQAHVGSPDVYYQGEASPYHLIVMVRTPPMIPGVAEIEIRSSKPGVQHIDVVPLYIVGPGSKYPPPPDALTRFKDDPQFFSGKLWLMASGSWQVRIHVEGVEGQGELAVPVAAFARRTLPMQKALGALLFTLMTILVLAIVSILGAASREGGLELGSLPGPAEIRRARIVTGAAAFAVVGMLLLGNWWWNTAARTRAQEMIYKPPPLAVSLNSGGQVILRVGDSEWHRNRPDTVMTKLIPDHGHLMHLFLIRLPSMDRFYHLHPAQTQENVFSQPPPTLPAGHYQIYADIVRESGFPDTMVAETDLPDISGIPLSGDDSETSAPPISTFDGDSEIASLPDGGRIVWERGAALLSANQLIEFRFRVENRNGKPAMDLQPYMGMPAHIEIVAWDRSVFAHVHPDGSVSMAALSLVEQSLGLAAASGPSATQLGPASPEISFPYGFPKPGVYRLFVQVQHADQIVTGVFDARVNP